MGSSIPRVPQTLEIPLLELDKDIAKEFSRLERLNAELANRIMAMPRENRSKLNAQHFADIDLGGAWMEQTIRKACAQSDGSFFYTLPLETDSSHWKLHRDGDMFLVSFKVFRGAKKRSRMPLLIQDTSHFLLLESLLCGEAEAGNLQLHCSKSGVWYVVISVLSDARIVSRWIGVDRGKMVPVAAASPDGSVTFLKDGKIQHVLNTFAEFRSELQSLGEHEGLKDLESMERRVITNINLSISEDLVAMAERLGAGIRLEDLPNTCQTKTHGSSDDPNLLQNWGHWAFCQLDTFIKQEAQKRGVVIDVVPPDFTSQTCHRCGALNKRYQQSFFCKRCGHRAHADANAALVIRDWYGMYCPLDIKNIDSESIDLPQE